MTSANKLKDVLSYFNIQNETSTNSIEQILSVRDLWYF